ncbi:MAG: cold shock domain-containing protein, partial [Calditrichaeota bacterium]|nr:cold shock domain-containing protein [Calditrichota bacterium]
GVESREVRLLRRFRDRRLLPSASGRLLTRIYYRTSPPLARLLRRSPRLRGLSRRMIQGMIRWLKLD